MYIIAKLSPLYDILNLQGSIVKPRVIFSTVSIVLLLSYLIEEADGKALPVLHRGSHWGEVGR